MSVLQGWADECVLKTSHQEGSLCTWRGFSPPSPLLHCKQLVSSKQ